MVRSGVEKSHVLGSQVWAVYAQGTFSAWFLAAGRKVVSGTLFLPGRLSLDGWGNVEAVPRENIQGSGLGVFGVRERRPL